MEPAPATAEGPDARRSTSSPSNGSILSSRQSRLSSVASGRRVPVAIALDFQGDGTCQRHACWSLPDDPSLIPPFHAPPTAKSVRVIFYHTPMAEHIRPGRDFQSAQGLPGLSRSHGDEFRAIEHCLDCFPNGINRSTPSLSNNGSVSANHVDDPSDSWTDEISPGASLARPRSASTHNSLPASEKQEGPRKYLLPSHSQH